MEFGRRLQDERYKLRLSLEDIEEETKIRKYYIEALENEDFSVLPPPVYACGFVKRYATLLGLDEQEMVGIFRELAYGKEEPEEEPQVPIVAERTSRELRDLHEPRESREFRENREPREPRKPLPIKNIAAGLVFLVLVLWLGTHVSSWISNRGKDKVNQPNQVQQNKNQVAAPQNQAPTPPASQPPAVQGVKVDITAVSRCWMSITVDGQPQFNQTLPAGQTKTFTGKKSVLVKVGNAGGVKIIVNGQQIPPLGATGEVKEKEFKATS